jgi:hypothetical protein
MLTNLSPRPESCPITSRTRVIPCGYTEVRRGDSLALHGVDWKLEVAFTVGEIDDRSRPRLAKEAVAVRLEQVFGGLGTGVVRVRPKPEAP